MSCVASDIEDESMSDTYQSACCKQRGIGRGMVDMKEDRPLLLVQVRCKLYADSVEDLVFCCVLPVVQAGMENKRTSSFPAVPDIMTRSRFENIQRYDADVRAHAIEPI